MKAKMFHGFGMIRKLNRCETEDTLLLDKLLGRLKLLHKLRLFYRM